jgi:methylaspartate ammonia-lyase
LKILGFKGGKYVKYVDVLSGRLGMIVVVKVTEAQNAKIIAFFMIFQNPKSKYPIHGVLDNILSVSYRSANHHDIYIWMPRVYLYGQLCIPQYISRSRSNIVAFECYSSEFASQFNTFMPTM